MTRKYPLLSTTLAALIARLSPPPRPYLETADGVDEPQSGYGRRYWVVSRGLCRFFGVPLLAEATGGRQLEALSLEIGRLLPFAETGSHFHLGKDIASVWLWDQQRTRRAAEAIGIAVDRLRILPEPALLARADDGLRLIEAMNGFEAQCWRDGCITASRWWPSPPDDREWLLFQRGASVLPDRIGTGVPDPERPVLLHRPWTNNRAPGAFALSEIDLRSVAAIAVACLLIAYGYVGAEWLRASRDLAAITAEIKTRSEAVMPLLTDRARALDNQAAIQGLNRLDQFPSQLALMARVVEALPPDGTRLTDWAFDRGQLELSIAASRPIDVVSLVRSLENIEHFKSVAVERTGTDNTLRLRATINAL